MKFGARVISKGYAEGYALVSKKPVSFLGDVSPENGVIVDRENEIYGESVSGRIFVFPEGRGSTVGSYTLLRMKKRGCAPAGIIMLRSEAIIAVGAIVAEIPLVDLPEVNVVEEIKNDDFVRIYAGKEGWIEVDR